MSQRDIIARLAAMQYERNELEIQARHLPRGGGDILDVFPAENSETALRIALADDEVESLMLFDPLTGHASPARAALHGLSFEPLRHAPATTLRAIEAIKIELAGRIDHFQKAASS